MYPKLRFAHSCTEDKCLIKISRKYEKADTLISFCIWQGCGDICD